MHARSLLFLPASNARAIEKAHSLACDMVILDLEDAVADEKKDEARAALKPAFAQGFGQRIGAVRVNESGSDSYRSDCAALDGVDADILILPKVESAETAQALHEAVGKPVIAMIESPAGVAHVREIVAADGVVGLFMGNNDLRHDLRIPMDADRSGLMLSMQEAVLAARLVGKAVFDGVYNKLDDPDGFRAECWEGRNLGFDGKTLIHPNQIAPANEIFGPSEQELANAHALIAAATGGAERFEGRMIEAMHVAQARALLEKAGGA